MIHKSTAACIALLSLLAGSQPDQTPNVQDGLIDVQIVGGWVFDSPSARFIRNPGLAIRGGRFVKFSAAEPTSQRIELSDEDYILPGLIDCHAHYNVKLLRKRREEFDVLPVQYLANGVTVTFSCGEFDPEEMQKLRKRIEQGKQVGPRLINSGPYFGRARPGWRGIKPMRFDRKSISGWHRESVDSKQRRSPQRS